MFETFLSKFVIIVFCFFFFMWTLEEITISSCGNRWSNLLSFKSHVAENSAIFHRWRKWWNELCIERHMHCGSINHRRVRSAVLQPLQGSFSLSGGMWAGSTLSTDGFLSAFWAFFSRLLLHSRFDLVFLTSDLTIVTKTRKLALAQYS